MMSLDMSDEAFHRLKSVLKVARTLNDTQRSQIAAMLADLCGELNNAEKLGYSFDEPCFDVKLAPFALNMIIGSTLLVMSLLDEAEGGELT